MVLVLSTLVIKFRSALQALRSWAALKTVFRDRMFQFWLKFW